MTPQTPPRVSRETRHLSPLTSVRQRVVHDAVIALRKAGVRVDYCGGRSWRLSHADRAFPGPRVRLVGTTRLVALAGGLPPPATMESPA